MSEFNKQAGLEREKVLRVSVHGVDVGFSVGTMLHAGGVVSFLIDTATSQYPTP